MNPPVMASWNLALRFGLEIGAVAGLATVAWRSTGGPMRWLALVVVPAAAIAAWTLFNVPDDPSRSGTAPIVVPGAIRLAIELTILLAGAAALTVRGPQWIGVGLASLIVVHYAVSIPRVEWLLHK